MPSAVLTADEHLTTTVSAPSPTLTFALGPQATYTFNAIIEAVETNVTDGGVQLGFTLAAPGGTLTWSITGGGPTRVSGQTVAFTGFTDQTVFLGGVATTGTQGGTLTLIRAQAVSSANPTILRAGSTLTAQSTSVSPAPQPITLLRSYTVNDLIYMALLDAGIISQSATATAFDSNNAFTRLNWLLGEWNRERFLIYHLVDLSVVSTGKQSYTIGPGGDINVSLRPDKLEKGCFQRQLVPSQPSFVDYPLELLHSREDYNRIVTKGIVAFAYNIFYDPAWPMGVLYPWPVPLANIYEIHVLVKEVLTEFETLTDTVILPREYFSALYLTLAERMRMGYDLPEKPELTRMAKQARDVVRGASAAVAQLQMPLELVRRGIYNPYSDQIQ
jgi:hypothetical protein